MKLNTFKPTKGLRNWCGPTALSILTGRTIGYCAKLSAEIASRQRYRHSYNQGWHSVKHTAKTIKGVDNSEMEYAANKMGFRFKRVVPVADNTLFKFMEDMTGPIWKEALLINVTDHYVVAQRGICYDNHDTTGTDSRKFWCRRRKVLHVWIVERIK